MTRESEVLAVAGDWHGNARWAAHVIACAAAAGVRTILHVGDFGFWPGGGGRQYLSEVHGACIRHKIRIYVTPGNHEDWDQIEALTPIDAGDGFGPALRFTDRIAAFPRVHRFTRGGVEFCSVAGAPSIDKHMRVPGRSWWPQEMPTEDDVAAAVAGGVCQVLLTHDSSDHAVPAVRRILGSGGGWPKSALEYCAVGRERMTRVVEATRPRIHVHGHFHAPDAAEWTPQGWDTPLQVVSLGMDGQIGNAVLLRVGGGTASVAAPDVDPAHQPQVRAVSAATLRAMLALEG